MEKQEQYYILYIAVALIIASMIVITLYTSPQGQATDVSNDQPPLFINNIGNGNSSVGNTNIPCTYLIFIVNNLTSSKNCSDGTLFLSNQVDAYTVIEKTIQQINSGGILFVKQGNYFLSHEIDINKTSITIQGEGHGTSILHGVTKFTEGKGTKLSNVMLIPSGINVNNIVLRDFFIYGNALNNTGAGTVGIFSQNTEDALFQDITVYNMTGRGIELQNNHAGHFVNIYSEYNAGSGFYIFGPDATVGSTGNSFTGLYSNGFGFGDSFVLEGNVHDNTFTGNIGQDDKGRCFVVFADSGGKIPTANTFTGNECVQLSQNDGQYGFDLFGIKYNTFTGNIVFNMGQHASNTYDGFRLSSISGFNSVNNTFTGNDVISSGVTNHLRYGFNEVNKNQDFNVYDANNIAGMSTRAMNISGTHSRTIANLGYNPVASSTVTAGASVWTYTNTDSYTEKMILSTVNGQTAETCTGVNQLSPTTIGAVCTLDIGQSLTATWATTAPIYTKVPMD